jgi:dephospho-CoA kinase
MTQKNDKRLLLGVTGSIATGKSTVALMLEELGAPIIDFDALSRVVMEPDTPAWKDIVRYFGTKVLHGDNTLDREKLREIVFQDVEKRKKLEHFTHPRIFEAFHKQVEEVSAKQPGAIIQVVVPLLIEGNLQSMFDHVLLVYVPEEEQLKRLIKRDQNTRELAVKIIQSQISVDEKKKCCDFLVDNSGSLEDTRAQVNLIWEKLLKIQKQRPQLNPCGSGH